MGLKVPRFDKLQDTCSNLVANLNYFNWREYVVRASDMESCSVVDLEVLPVAGLAVNVVRRCSTFDICACVFQ